MDPTSLPTDNLYKFMALSGLGLAGFCIWMWWKVAQDLAAKRNALDEETARISSRLDSLVKMMNILKKSPPKFQAAVKTPESKEVADMYTELLMAHRSEIAEQAQDLVQASEAAALSTAREKAFRISGASMRRLQRVLVGGTIAGLIVSVAGFGLWYCKLQRHLDKQVLQSIKS